ncbi:MAG: CHAT domain-containing protein [Actinobacteria bacterium]|nr:CHAT domain-containing protein [Actinomycetota bacterium]
MLTLEPPISLEARGLLGWLPVHAVVGHSRPLCVEVGLSYRHPRACSAIAGDVRIDLVIADLSLGDSGHIASLAPDATHLFFDSEAGSSLSAQVVLTHLEGSRGFLYYGHGAERVGEAGDSCLYLGDGERVTVGQLLRSDLRGNDLGVLVACSSGRPDPFLSVPISLMSAAATAGCRQVIGTLWPIMSNDGAEFAKKLLLDNWIGRSCEVSWQELIDQDVARFGAFSLLSAPA